MAASAGHYRLDISPEGDKSDIYQFDSGRKCGAVTFEDKMRAAWAQKKPYIFALFQQKTMSDESDWFFPRDGVGTIQIYCKKAKAQGKRVDQIPLFAPSSTDTVHRVFLFVFKNEQESEQRLLCSNQIDAISELYGVCSAANDPTQEQCLQLWQKLQETNTKTWRKWVFSSQEKLEWAERFSSWFPQETRWKTAYTTLCQELNIKDEAILDISRQMDASSLIKFSLKETDRGVSFRERMRQVIHRDLPIPYALVVLETQNERGQYVHLLRHGPEFVKAHCREATRLKKAPEEIELRDYSDTKAKVERAYVFIFREGTHRRLTSCTIVCPYVASFVLNCVTTEMESKSKVEQARLNLCEQLYKTVSDSFNSEDLEIDLSFALVCQELLFWSETASKEFPQNARFNELLGYILYVYAIVDLNNIVDAEASLASQISFSKAENFLKAELKKDAKHKFFHDLYMDLLKAKIEQGKKEKAASIPIEQQVESKEVCQPSSTAVDQVISHLAHINLEDVD